MIHDTTFGIAVLLGSGLAIAKVAQLLRLPSVIVFILNDIILGINGVRVRDYNQLRDEVEKYQVGETITLTLVRDNRQINVDVVLDAL